MARPHRYGNPRSAAPIGARKPSYLRGDSVPLLARARVCLIPASPAGPGPGGDEPRPRARPSSSASAQRARGWSGAGRGGAGGAGANGHAPGSRAGGCGPRARTLGMEGERRASPERSSGLPAGGADGESPGGGGPLLRSRGSSALLQVDVLDLDEDEDDLEVFSKVRAVGRVPGKFPVNSGSRQRRGLPARRARPAGAEARSWRWVGSPGCGTQPGPDSQPPLPLHYDLPWGRASCNLQSCDFPLLPPFLPSLFSSDTDFWGQCPNPGGGGSKVPQALAAFSRAQPAPISGRIIRI